MNIYSALSQQFTSHFKAFENQKKLEVKSSMKYSNPDCDIDGRKNVHFHQSKFEWVKSIFFYAETI